jgi:CheY-like chemotaxis protein
VDIAVLAQQGETSRDLMACVAEDESLEMAKELVNRCNGHLEIEVSTGESANQQSSQIASVISARFELPAAEQTTVLVIDDNADVLQLFERYMTGTRYRFIGTQSAPDGLDRARTIHPQIIVLDVMMPGRDGWTLLGQLREHPETRDIPVIVCTILSQTELAMVLGAADFVRKPVNRAEFLEALGRQTLSQRRESD